MRIRRLRAIAGRMSHARNALASMTGFARTQGSDAGAAWAWELRSVNGRGLDLRLRLPPGFDSLEAGLRDLAGKRIARGHVSASLTLRQEKRAQVGIDETALAAALAALARLRHHLPEAPPPRLEAVLALPGVMRPADAEEDAAARTALAAALAAGFERALDELAAARLAEGERLAEVLGTLLDELAVLHAEAVAEAATQPAALRERLLAAIAALGAQVPLPSEERLAQEVAMLAAKADVREELDRLAAHIVQARALLAEGRNVGRRLDFLTQEFNREANTLCSKSASAGLTAIGLRLKAAIERLREQVQNVE
jgi:uncharacterized protein (TIGR00255 family)